MALTWTTNSNAIGGGGGDDDDEPGTPKSKSGPRQFVPILVNLIDGRMLADSLAASIEILVACLWRRGANLKSAVRRSFAWPSAVRSSFTFQFSALEIVKIFLIIMTTPHNSALCRG